jgi:hypothetical protein
MKILYKVLDKCSDCPYMRTSKGDKKRHVCGLLPVGEVINIIGFGEDSIVFHAINKTKCLLPDKA